MNRKNLISLGSLIVILTFATALVISEFKCSNKENTRIIIQKEVF